MVRSADWQSADLTWLSTLPCQTQVEIMHTTIMAYKVVVQRLPAATKHSNKPRAGDCIALTASLWTILSGCICRYNFRQAVFVGAIFVRLYRKGKFLSGCICRDNFRQAVFVGAIFVRLYRKGKFCQVASMVAIF